MASSIGENLRTVLAATTGVAALVSTTSADRIHQNIIPKPMVRPAIWYTRAASEAEVDTAGNNMITDSSWDIECQAEDLDDCLSLADAVKTELNGKHGTFGDSSILGAFVTDHDDDYLPKGIGESDDAHIHLAALSVQILHA